MKKAFIAVAIVLAAGLMTSCNKEGCYKVVVKTTIAGVTVEAPAYVYGTPDDVDNFIEEAKAQAGNVPGVTLDITKQRVNKSEEDCAAMNEGLLQ
ncbi:MAG: hypothetical protein ACI3Z5_02600 [Paludibacteraceae bacterium]|nr:hypothetical protein [Bacteroidales bacterium]